MKVSISQTFAVSLLSLLISGASAQSTAAAAPGPIQTLDCYKSPDPLTSAKTDQYQTDGLCQTECAGQNMPVMAITGGSTCYCGEEIPALDQQVDKSKCDSPCQGFGSKMCGGIGYWQVYLTGITGDVKQAPNSTAASSSSGSTSHAAATVVVTEAAHSSGAVAASSGGPSKIGIAVGVVVGVIIVAAVIGGIVFFMKQRRKRELEEEYKQQATISSFVSANKSAESKSTTDQRLDPTVFAARRESVGSIADERDFSRRILQVRNPDNRGSVQSMA